MTVVSDRQIVSVHTRRGVQLHQIVAGVNQASVRWRRESGEVSTCEVVCPVTADDAAVLAELQPWTDWVSVWDEGGTELYWTGPVVAPSVGRATATVACRDYSAVAARTRIPDTRRWEFAPLTDIAGELWDAMIGVHGLAVPSPIRLPDPYGDRFDFDVTADTAMLDDTLRTLTGLGLRWTVVAGAAVLGPAPRRPVAALGDHDFLGDGPRLVRDGLRMANDVLLRCADDEIRVRAPAAGLNLQALVRRDNVSGVSNAERAARQYLRRTAEVREVLTFDGATGLHPDAPLTADQLIPSARVTVEFAGRVQVMELHAVEVSCTPKGTTVTVTPEAVDDRDPNELAKDERGR